MTELTADVVRAAEILHAHPVTVRELAASGRLRGRKVGRSWVFVVEDLLAYIRQGEAPTVTRVDIPAPVPASRPAPGATYARLLGLDKKRR